MLDLQGYPWMRCLIKCELDIQVFGPLNWLIWFAVSRQKVTIAHFLLMRNNREIHRNKHFLRQRDEGIMFDQIMVSMDTIVNQALSSMNIGLQLCLQSLRYWQLWNFYTASTYSLDFKVSQHLGVWFYCSPRHKNIIK